GCLDQQCEAVRCRLNKSDPSGAHWPIAVWHAAENYPPQQGNEREEREKHPDRRQNVYERRCDLHHPIRRTRQRPEQQLFYADENLVKRINHLYEEKRCSIL